MSTSAAIPPPVLWAQRSSQVFLTFNVECEKPDIIIENKTVTFKGICKPENKLHEVEIPLYSEVDPEQSVQVNKGRCIEVVLKKVKSDEGFWPALTCDKKKYHWLKIDFNRWQDEDEGVEDIDDMGDMFSSKLNELGDESGGDDPFKFINN